MSKATLPPPNNPAPAPVSEPAPIQAPVQDGPSLITPGEISGILPVQQPADPPVVHAPPSPAPDPAPNPDNPPPPAVDPLAGLFGDPQGTPPAQPGEPGLDEPPPDATPQWYRDAIKRNNDAFAARQKEIEDARAAAERERDELRQQVEAARREQALIDPMQDPEVQNLSSRLTEQIKGVARSLSPKSAREFIQNGKPLIEQFSNLGEVYDEGYDDRYQALRNEVNKTYGADADEIFRNLHSLASTAADMRDRIVQASSNSEDILHGRMERAHQEAARGLDEIYGNTLSFSEELSKTNPFAPQNIISRLIDQVPDFKGHSENIRKMLKDSLIPPKPLSRTQLAAMTPEQRNQAQAQQNQAYQQAYQGVYQGIPLAFHALAALPVLAEILSSKNKEITDLRALVPNPPPPGTIPSNSPTPAPAPAPPGGFRPITPGEVNR